MYHFLKPPVIVHRAVIVMSKIRNPKIAHPIGVFFIGLLMAQVLATIQVYASNFNLYSKLTAINAAGYFIVPNQHVMGRLKEFAPAFYGGLFFTFSFGAGITLFTMAAVWLGYLIPQTKKGTFYSLLSLWLGFLVLVNIDGMNIFPTMYLLLIPPLVFRLMAKRFFPKKQTATQWHRIINLLPVPLLALLWAPQFDGSLFLDLRDHLLLSNPLGKKFTRFYYTYTLYPAESFKSLNQKLLRTCRITGVKDGNLHQLLERELLDHDYLPIKAIGNLELSLSQKDDTLVFANRNCEYVRSSVSDFLKDSKKLLINYALQNDPNRILRQLTFFGLLAGFPIAIFIVFHGVIYYAFNIISDAKTSTIIASIVCFLLGFIVLVYFQASRSSQIEIRDITQALQSVRWQDRVAALKIITANKLEISNYPGYRFLLKSDCVQERYWLVKALGVSRTHPTYLDLLGFLDDPSPNVLSMSFNSLGRRNNPQAIPMILDKLHTSSDWYSQVYAYKALRSLGWKQTRSK
jgi:hypothetical protein